MVFSCPSRAAIPKGLRASRCSKQYGNRERLTSRGTPAISRRVRSTFVEELVPFAIGRIRGPTSPAYAAAAATLRTSRRCRYEVCFGHGTPRPPPICLLFPIRRVGEVFSGELLPDELISRSRASRYRPPRSRASDVDDKSSFRTLSTGARQFRPLDDLSPSREGPAC